MPPTGCRLDAVNGHHFVALHSAIFALSHAFFSRPSTAGSPCDGPADVLRPRWWVGQKPDEPVTRCWCPSDLPFNACATEPVAPRQRSVVPSSRVFLARLGRPLAAQRRKSERGGSGCSTLSLG